MALVSYLVTTKTLRKVADQCRAVEEEVIFDVSNIFAIKYCISMTLGAWGGVRVGIAV